MTDVDPIELPIEVRQIAHHRPLPRAPWLPTVVTGHPLSVEPDAAGLRMSLCSGLHLRMLGGDMWARVTRLRVLVGDHGPAILDGEFVLVRGHDGALRFVWLHQGAFTYPPEPIGLGHLADHRSIQERPGLGPAPGGVGSVSRAVLS